MEAITGVIHLALIVVGVIAAGVASFVGFSIYYQQSGQEEGE